MPDGQEPPNSHESAEPQQPRNEDSPAYRIAERIGEVIAIPLLIAVLIGLFFLVRGIIGALTDNDTSVSEKGTASPTTEMAARPTTTATEPPATTRRAVALTPPNPRTVVRDEILKAIDDKQNDARILVPATHGDAIVVDWKVSENLTEGLTKDQLRIEIKMILQDIRKGMDRTHTYWSGGTRLRARYLLVDQFGNERVREVMEADFSLATIRRINFGNVLAHDGPHEAILLLADRYHVHPAFQY